MSTAIRDDCTIGLPRAAGQASRPALEATSSRLVGRVAGDHGRLAGLRVRSSGPDGGLIRALAGLVAGQGLGRVDVAERRVFRRHLVPARRADAESLAED